jgi:AcrR family transcriptional regulator
MFAVKGEITQVGVIMSRWQPKEEMQERILETADRLFYGRGIRAVGVDTIADEIGISKRTLYNHYPSKDALIVAYLSRRLVPLEVSEAPPLAQLLGAFDRLERSLSRGSFRGCPFVNAVAEIGEELPEASRVAVAFKERRRLWFRDLLGRLDIKDADALASQLAILLDGAVAVGLVRRDPAMARAARQAAEALVRQSMLMKRDGRRKTRSSRSAAPPTSRA